MKRFDWALVSGGTSSSMLGIIIGDNKKNIVACQSIATCCNYRMRLVSAFQPSYLTAVSSLSRKKGCTQFFYRFHLKLKWFYTPCIIEDNVIHQFLFNILELKFIFAKLRKCNIQTIKKCLPIYEDSFSRRQLEILRALVLFKLLMSEK